MWDYFISCLCILFHWSSNKGKFWQKRLHQLKWLHSKGTNQQSKRSVLNTKTMYLMRDWYSKYVGTLSVQFSHSVVSDSLRPHELQHTKPPCPSPTPGIHSDSHPSSQWCHPAISSSVIPFSSCPQSLPASESFPMSQLFAWDGQSTGVSALASFLPKKSCGVS